MARQGNVKAGGAGDTQKVRESAGQILEQYGSTTYATLGALASGKVQAQAGELKNARSQLAWVVANAPEAAVRDIARLRLAAVQFDEGSHADALATLAAAPVAELAAGFADLRGDIHAADGFEGTRTSSPGISVFAREGSWQPDQARKVQPPATASRLRRSSGSSLLICVPMTSPTTTQTSSTMKGTW